MEDFTEIKLDYQNLDRFIIRKAIFNALKKNISNFKGTILDIGCGKMPYKNYILQNTEVQNYLGLDIESALIYDSNTKPDFFWDGIKMPFENESFDCAFGTEVLEHCPEPEIVLNEVFRVLKPNSTFFFTVPFLWNLHEIPHDEYRYTPYSLERHLQNCGFKNINIQATGGWHTSMAQMLGLWVKRSPMSFRKKKLLSYFIKPIMKYLINKGVKENIEFREGLMITGLSGTATK